MKLPRSKTVPKLLDDDETLFLTEGPTSLWLSRWKRVDDRIEATFHAFSEEDAADGLLFKRSDGRRATVSPWTLTGILELADGHVTVQRLTVLPTSAVIRGARLATPLGGLSSRRLQAAGPRMQSALAIARSLVYWGMHPGDLTEQEFRKNVLETHDDAPIGRLDQAHYLKVARRYLSLQRQGIRNGLVAQLADALGEELTRNVSLGTARSWIRGAEARGYLTSPRQGHAADRQPGPNYTEED